MRLDDIQLEDIIGTALFWENPDICFVSPLYDKSLKVTKNGNVMELDYAADYNSLIEPFDIKKLRAKLLIKSLTMCLIISLIMSLFGTVINIGSNFLFKEPGYWKYMILQFSTLSAFLFGFATIFEIKFFNKNWTQKCILNSTILKPSKDQKCDIFTAKKDLNVLFSANNISLNHSGYVPYGDKYFCKLLKAIKNYSYRTDIIAEYNKTLSNINCSPSIIKSILSFAIGVGIEVFSFLDLYGELELFRNNMILSSVLVVILSLTLSYFLVKYRFESSYIKLDSLLYLYSYMYLEMPFSTNEEHDEVPIENIDVNNLEATIDYCIEQYKKKVDFYVFKRLVVLKDNSLIIYKSNIKENFN